MDIIKTGKNRELPLRWALIEDYLNSELTLEALSEKYSIPKTRVESIIKDTYREFQNVRETRLMVSNRKSDPSYIQKIQSEYIDPERINREFLNRLSDPNSEKLTDYEMLFCEYLVDKGDEILSIIESGLDIGLNRDSKSKYKNSIVLRAFYLKRKPNINLYLKELEKAKILEIEEDIKGRVQSKLLSTIEKLGSSSDPKSTSLVLRAIELLGKTKGVFEERQVIEHVDADGALDRILERARDARANKRELHLTKDGTEIYQ